MMGYRACGDWLPVAFIRRLTGKMVICITNYIHNRGILKMSVMIKPVIENQDGQTPQPPSDKPDTALPGKGFLSSFFTSASIGLIFGPLLASMTATPNKPSDILAPMGGVALGAAIPAINLMLMTLVDVVKGKQDSAISTCSFSSGMATASAAASAFIAVAPATPFLLSIGAGAISAVNLALAYQAASAAYGCATDTMIPGDKKIFNRSSDGPRLSPKKVLAGIVAGSALTAASVLGPGIYAMNSMDSPSASDNKAVLYLPSKQTARIGHEMRIAGHVFTVPNCALS
jgi:hypothetical protein